MQLPSAASSLAVLLVLGGLLGGLSRGPASAAEEASLAIAPIRLVAYGDSFTRAAEPLVGDQPEKSWATGTDPAVASLLGRLRARDPNAVGYNAAVSGARIQTLGPQVASSPPGADEVVVFFGINDVCMVPSTPLEVFRAQARAGLEAIALRHPKATVVVYAIPNLLQLSEVWVDEPAAISFRRALPYCRDYFLPPSEPAAEAALLDRLAAYNQVLASEAEVHGYRFSDATYRMVWTRADLSSLDFFHPTRTGQAHLAQVAAPSVLASSAPVAEPSLAPFLGTR